MKSVYLKEQALAAELLVLRSENAMAVVSIPALWSMSLDLSLRPDRILLVSAVKIGPFALHHRAGIGITVATVEEHWRAPLAPNN